ncbi:TfoX/Sxy family protein [Chitinophaga sp. OAE865]|uniref:TfoX/Sxy family protein n=1 Tax=Chitinophaga sp. OAE865 TaxID=2817898 RepID=UPI001AE511D6
MAYNEKLAERIRQALAHLPGVEEKKMFGSLAFMVNGKMCLAAGPGRMMCRIDPGIHEEALKKKGSQTVIMKGRAYKGFIYVDDEYLKTRAAFDYWVKLALGFNGQARASVKK